MIDSQDYVSILEVAEYRKIQKLITFFITYLFSGLSRNYVTKYSYNFEKIKFKWKQVIFNYNEAPNFIYLIKKGEVTIFKVAFHLKKKYELSKLNNLMNSTVSHQKNEVEICTLEKGQNFGDLELLLKTNRQYKAVCNSQQLTVYRLHYNQFKRILSDNQDYRERFY